MTRCPSWCDNPIDGHTAHQALMQLHGLTALVTRNDWTVDHDLIEVPRLHVTATPADAIALSALLLDAVALLVDGCDVRVSVRPPSTDQPTPAHDT